MNDRRHTVSGNRLHVTVLAMGLWCAASLNAQSTRIVVKDDAGMPVPAAHVTFSSIAEKRSVLVITTMNGVAAPADSALKGDAFDYRITYLGFEPATGTIAKGETKTVRLKPSATMLGQVVVTGQYAPESNEKTVHKITVIESRKIEALSSNSLDKLLSRELNMRIAQDNILGSSIRLQGLSGENVKILIDGVPVIGRMNGNVDLSQIDLSNIERIEVVEGPLSVSYGSNALAGTINLITKKKSEKPLQADISGYYENIGTFNFNGRLGFDKNRFYGNVSFGRKFFNGWNPGDPVFGDLPPYADSSRVKLWKPRTQYLGEVHLGYRLKEGFVQYRANLFHEKISNLGYPRPPYGEYAFDDEYITRRIDNSIQAETKIGSTTGLNVIGAYNYFQRQKLGYVTDLTTLQRVPNEADGGQDTTVNDLLLLRATLSGSPENIRWRWQAGLDLNSERVAGRRIENGRQVIGDYAAFGSVEYRPGLRWTLRPGLRLSYNTAYGSPVVPSFFAKFEIKPGMQVRASLARGFRAPSVKELYMDFVDINHDIRGNASLQAETSLHSGVHFSYARLKGSNSFRVRGSLFFNNINNRIALAQVSGISYTYRNIGQTQNLGANADLQMILGHLRLNFGVAVTGTRNRLSGSDAYGRLALSPQLNANGTYGIRQIGMELSLFVNYIGRLPQFTVDENDNLREQYIDHYTLVDFTVNQTFWNERITVGTGVKNILNVINVASTVSGGSHGAGDLTRPIAPGRVYFLKIGLHF